MPFCVRQPSPRRASVPLAYRRWHTAAGVQRTRARRADARLALAPLLVLADSDAGPLTDSDAGPLTDSDAGPHYIIQERLGYRP